VRLHEVIFEADTPAGRAFDVALLIAILVSVVAVMLESVADIRREYGGVLRAVEWTITIAFTVEYVLRLAAVDHPWRYARSFFGIVDLLAIWPTYLALLVPAAQSLIVIRTIRLLRVFRILKLAHFLGEAQELLQALRASRRKITVFLGAIVSSIVIMGTLMYLVEGEEHGFTSIPTSMYWAVVTMTTVGYGDLAPKTPLGRVLAATLMILGYAIIAVPTGIVSVELAKTGRGASRQACLACGAEGHDEDAAHCKYCGASL
jgi:voltage-gated potassium channel